MRGENLLRSKSETGRTQDGVNFKFVRHELPQDPTGEGADIEQILIFCITEKNDLNFAAGQNLYDEHGRQYRAKRIGNYEAAQSASLIEIEVARIL